MKNLIPMIILCLIGIQAHAMAPGMSNSEAQTGGLIPTTAMSQVSSKQLEAMMSRLGASLTRVKTLIAEHQYGPALTLAKKNLDLVKVQAP